MNGKFVYQKILCKVNMNLGEWQIGMKVMGEKHKKTSIWVE